MLPNSQPLAAAATACMAAAAMQQQRRRQQRPITLILVGDAKQALNEYGACHPQEACSPRQCERCHEIRTTRRNKLCQANPSGHDVFNGSHEKRTESIVERRPFPPRRQRERRRRERYRPKRPPLQELSATTSSPFAPFTTKAGCKSLTKAAQSMADNAGQAIL
jgi:hypothetical protein